MKKQPKYTAIRMATAQLFDKPKEHLTVKIKNDWAYLYYKGKKVFDCNKIFFEYNFIQEN